MAKKTDAPALLPELSDGPLEGEPTPTAVTPGIASIGQSWLDHQSGIEKAEAEFYAAMRAKKVTASKPINIDGRRFFPGRNGKVGEVRDFA